VNVPGRPRPPWAARASRWALAASIAGSALAVGTVHTMTLCVVTAVLAGAATLAWWGAEPMRVRPPATLLLCVGVGLVAYTLFQCVPMPVRWLAVIAPHNADVWSRSLAPLHEAGPAWAPVSLDPAASRIEVVKGVAYLLAFVTALRVAHRREGVAFLSATIAATGILLALAAVLHPAFGAHKLFGVYEPGPGIAERHIAPLMNPNNLAGYINVAFCLAMSASLSREARVPRAIAVAVTVLLAVTQAWVASRGGVIALVLGALTVAALALSERVKRRDPTAWLSAGCGVAVVLGAVSIVVATSTDAKSELSITDVSKFSVLVDVARMLPAYGIFGAGRGAFESVFPQFRDAVNHLTVTQPENIVAQWVAEWGVPVGVVGLAGVVTALRPTAVLARSSTAGGAWAALAAIAVQNMADFSSEIPGVMLTVVVCGAIVTAGSAGVAPAWRVGRWPRSPSAVAWTAALAGGLAVVSGLTALGCHVHEDRRRLYEAALVERVQRDPMHALVRAAMLRHPAEPYLPFVAGLRAMHAGDESPVPWLGATLERARVYGPAHLLLARIVAPRSPSQARLEYRLALEQSHEISGMVAEEAPRLVGSFDDAMELVPDGANGIGMLESLVVSSALPSRLPAACVRLDDELGRRAPTMAGPSVRAAENAVSDLESGDGSPWCQGEARAGCIDRALTLVSKVEELEPTQCNGYVLEARALSVAGEPSRAMARLESVADRVADRVVCLRALAGLARASRDEGRLDAVLGEIARAGCAQDNECLGNLLWVAQVQEQRGSLRRALSAYKRAHERAPDDDSLLENAARLAARAGLNAEALEDYQELARRHPGEGRWAKAVEEQREATVRGATKL
jgi:tetratricopeptide (TPR) repeat protein